MHVSPDHHAGASPRGQTPARWRAAAGTATIPVSSFTSGVALDPATHTAYGATTTMAPCR
jgi:hypothetical protein